MSLWSIAPTPAPPVAVYPSVPPPPVLVCCHCKQRVTKHRFDCDGHSISSFHCARCGDTIAIPSAVVNVDAERCDG